jgi:hypothetical protein
MKREGKRMGPNDGMLVIEDARLIFRNFAGREGRYNREGDRNFCVLLDEKTAEDMERDGWNVKALRSREEGDPEQPYLQVSIGFKIRPPRLVLVTSKGRSILDEGMVELLDWVDIKTVDLTIRPYEWAVGGKTGIKAYLKTMYVTIHEDPLDLKYADLDELPARAGRVHELPQGFDPDRVVEGELA